MNATIYQASDVNEVAYRVEFRPARTAPTQTKSNRPQFGRRRANNPKQLSGIHRRRKKKITW